MSTPKPANAGAITRMLVKAGMRKSETHRSGMVKGWATFTEGVRSEAVMIHGRRRVQRGTYRDGSPRMTFESNNQPTGKVAVEYVASEHARRNDSALALSQREAGLAQARTILEAAGFVVETEERGTDHRVLIVYRTDANGDVVVF